MISVIKDKLGGNFVELSAKSYSYLIEYGSENKRAKSTKKCTKRKKLKLENYKKCLKGIQIENKTNLLRR